MRGEATVSFYGTHGEYLVEYTAGSVESAYEVERDAGHRATYRDYRYQDVSLGWICSTEQAANRIAEKINET